MPQIPPLVARLIGVTMIRRFAYGKFVQTESCIIKNNIFVTVIIHNNLFYCHRLSNHLHLQIVNTS